MAQMVVVLQKVVGVPENTVDVLARYCGWFLCFLFYFYAASVHSTPHRRVLTAANSI
jgi:hypothetical protein